MQAIGITLFESEKFGGSKLSGGGGKHSPGKQSMRRSDRSGRCKSFRFT